MTYLGLGPDEEYDDGYLYDDEHDDRAVASASPVREHSHVTSVPPSRAGQPVIDDSAGAVTAVRPLRPVGRSGGTPRHGYDETIELDDDHETSGIGRRGVLERDVVGGRDGSNGSDRSFGSGGRPRGSERSMSADRLHSEPVVRPVPIQRTKPRSLSPQSFGDAKILADELKDSVPVVMNLRDADRDLARRLIDFASGVCYSIDATMEKIAPQVFLLVPDQIVVSDEERRRLEERGFDR
jgi:cell division inhibitor SepF